MWKCPKCGLLQRIRYRCRHCGYKFPKGLTGDKLRQFHRKGKKVVVKNGR